MQQQEYRLGYRADLEGLRGIAILLVVAVHTGVPWLTGGYVGVDIFFVLSGFLITGLIVREKRTTGHLRFADFYVRRLRRLLPALFLMLIVVCGCAMLVLAPAGQRPQFTLASAASFWSSNIYLGVKQFDYFAQGPGANWFLHTWSLGVEEQFYLVWPALLVWLLGRGGAGGNLKRLKIALWLVAATSLVACITLTYTLPQPAFYMMPTRAWQFAVGALVWIYCMVPSTERSSPVVTRTHASIVGWLGLGLIAVASVWLSSTTAYPGPYALLPTLGAVALIFAGSGHGAPSATTRLLSIKPLQWIGHVSYSWYLWHWPVLMIGKALIHSDSPAYRVLLVAISFVVACASYTFVESPIRHQKLWLRWPRSTVGGALAVMVLAVGIGVGLHHRAVTQWATPPFRVYAAASDDWPAVYRGCDADSPVVKICSVGPANARHTVVLIGDSHAAQWYPAMKRVFDRPGWRLLLMFRHGCPMAMAPNAHHYGGVDDPVCALWKNNALAATVEANPDIVVISSFWGDFQQPTENDWLAGTQKVLRVLSPAAGHVYVFRDTPHLSFNGAYCLAERISRPSWLQWDSSCSAPSGDNTMRQIDGWVSAATQRFQNVSMINMNTFVCPKGRCKAERDGMVVYLDSNHLTANFAASLAPELGAKLGFPLGSSADASEGTAQTSGPARY